MEERKDAHELGYEDCLDREATSEWIETASLDELHDALLSIADVERSWIMATVDYLRGLFLASDTVFSPFVDAECLTSRLDKIDQFRFGQQKWINMRALFPEFYEFWGLVQDATASQPATPWEKAHSWLLRDFDDPMGPGDLDALTYAGRHSPDGPDSEKIRTILFEWATRIIRYKDPPDDAAKRAASGEMSIAEVKAIWEERHVGAYYIWSPRHSERLVCDGIVQRLASTFDLSGFEFWIDATAEEFMTGPVGGMDQVEGAIWLFWTLLGPHDLLSRTPASTLAAWGWAFTHSGRRGEPPWVLHKGIDDSGQPIIIHSVLIAAAYAFTAASSPSFGMPADRVAEAQEFLIRSQMTTGGWSDYVGDAFSIIATVMAAWVLHRTGGYSSEVEKALARLEDAADPTGGWSDQQQLGRIPFATLTSAILELHHEVAQSEEMNGTAAITARDRRFRVALTFPGEARELVKPIADELATILGKETVFYDQFYEAELARPNLDTYLQHIYRNDSDLVVPFLGSDYERKEWCGLEWRAVRDIIKKREDNRIMMMRLDDGVVPGTFEIDGYVDVTGRTASELAMLIIQRLESL